MTKCVVRHLSWIINESRTLIEFEFCFMTKCGCKLSSMLPVGYCKMVTNLTLFKVYRRIIFCRGVKMESFLPNAKKKYLKGFWATHLTLFSFWANCLLLLKKLCIRFRYRDFYVFVFFS